MARHRGEQLGRHEEGRADELAAPVIGAGSGQISHESEVGELPVAVGVEHVARLDVAVDHASAVEMVQPRGHVGEHGEGLTGIERAAGPVCLVVAQRPNGTARSRHRGAAHHRTVC